VYICFVLGAVLYGLDPKVIVERRSRLTYGMGVLNRFDPVKHPRSKLIHKDGVDWCVDVFDKIVLTDQSILLGKCLTLIDWFVGLYNNNNKNINKFL